MILMAQTVSRRPLTSEALIRSQGGICGGLRVFLVFHWRPWQATDVPQPNWLFVPPAFDFPTLATRCPRAYRRVPHSSGGSWNLWAGNKDR
jgi:hypothetical protein